MKNNPKLIESPDSPTALEDEKAAAMRAFGKGAVYKPAPQVWNGPDDDTDEFDVSQWETDPIN